MKRKKAIRIGGISLVAVIALAAVLLIPAATRKPFVYTSEQTVPAYTAIYRDLQPCLTAAYPAVEEPGFERKLENELLVLYLNRDTYEVLVFDKRSGQKWYSNPALHSEMADTSAVLPELQTQVSAIAVSEDNAEHPLNSFEHGLAYGQVSATQQDAALTVTYTLGKNQRDIRDLPPKFRDTAFRELYDRMDGAPKKELRKLYSFNNEHAVWVLATPEAVAQSTVQAVFQELDRIGFGQEEIDAEFEANRSERPIKLPVITVPVEYRLEGDSLRVRVVNEQIVLRNNCRIRELRILENFGSGRGDEQGTFLVPDGSGSLLEIGKESDAYYANVSRYRADVYGGDLSAFGDQPMVAQRAVTMPVFGVSRGGQSFLCTVESGAERAFFEVDPPKSTAYYRLYAGYSPCSAFVENYVNRLIYYYSDLMQNDYVARYRFFENENDRTVTLANEYQKYLVATGLLKKQNPSSGVPLHLELLGSVESRKQVLGVSYLDTAVLTGYAEAQQILQEISDMGYDAVSVLYKGIVKGGLRNTYVNRLPLNGQLGSGAQWEELLRFTKENNITLFPDMAVLWVEDTRNGFSPRLDAARDLRGKVYRIQPTNFVSMTQDKTAKSSYLLATDRILPTIKNMTKKATDYGFDALSLRDFGERLYSTKKDDRYFGTEYTAQTVVDAADYMEKQGKQLLLSNPNQYILRYASALTDVPTENNGYRVFTQRVPFVQMVLHGYVEYSGVALNATNNYDTAILKAVETGSILKFAVCAKPQEALKTSEVQGYYTAEFQQLRDDIAQLYPRLGSYYAAIAGARITDHRQLDTQVWETVYENGTRAVINYGETVYAEGNVAIQPRDFAVLLK